MNNSCWSNIELCTLMPCLNNNTLNDISQFPNPNCLASALTLSGSLRIRFFMISGRAQIAGIRVAKDPVTSFKDNRF